MHGGQLFLFYANEQTEYSYIQDCEIRSLLPGVVAVVFVLSDLCPLASHFDSRMKSQRDHSVRMVSSPCKLTSCGSRVESSRLIGGVQGPQEVGGTYIVTHSRVSKAIKLSDARNAIPLTILSSKCLVSYCETTPMTTNKPTSKQSPPLFAS